MDHRTEAGEVVYEILSDVDSESGEQGQEEPVEDEPQNLTPRADPLNAEHGKPEGERSSGWVMRQNQDSQMRYSFVFRNATIPFPQGLWYTANHLQWGDYEISIKGDLVISLIYNLANDSF